MAYWSEMATFIFIQRHHHHHHHHAFVLLLFIFGSFNHGQMKKYDFTLPVSFSSFQLNSQTTIATITATNSTSD